MFPYPHPLLMARIGEGYNRLLTDDAIDRLESEILSWEQYSAELEQRLKGLTERYRDLALNAGKLVEYTKSVERERDHLREENDRLLKVIRDLRSRSRRT
jgi:predicted  nucleic acid-binding Zn-ribbon protein